MQVFNDENDESYESKDLELEDIYESDEGGNENKLGIPANLAMTSHQMNENILLSFFPNIHEQQQQQQMLGGIDEEVKNADFFDVINGMSRNNQTTEQNLGSLANNILPTFQEK